MSQIPFDAPSTSPTSSNSASTPRQTASPANMFQNGSRASPTGISSAERLRALTDQIYVARAGPSSRSTPVQLEQDFDSETETAPEAGPSTSRAPVESSEMDSDVESMVNHSMTRTQPQTAQEKLKDLYRRTISGPSSPPLNDSPPHVTQRPRRASLESPVAKRVAPRRLSVSDEEDALSDTPPRQTPNRTQRQSLDILRSRLDAAETEPLQETPVQPRQQHPLHSRLESADLSHELTNPTPQRPSRRESLSYFSRLPPNQTSTPKQGSHDDQSRTESSFAISPFRSSYLQPPASPSPAHRSRTPSPVPPELHQPTYLAASSSRTGNTFRGAARRSPVQNAHTEEVREADVSIRSFVSSSSRSSFASLRRARSARSHNESPPVPPTAPGPQSSGDNSNVSGGASDMSFASHNDDPHTSFPRSVTPDAPSEHEHNLSHESVHLAGSEDDFADDDSVAEDSYMPPSQPQPSGSKRYAPYPRQPDIIEDDEHLEEEEFVPPSTTPRRWNSRQPDIMEEDEHVEDTDGDDFVPPPISTRWKGKGRMITLDEVTDHSLPAEDIPTRENFSQDTTAEPDNRTPRDVSLPRSTTSTSSSTTSPDMYKTPNTSSHAPNGHDQSQYPPSASSPSPPLRQTPSRLNGFTSRLDDERLRKASSPSSPSKSQSGNQSYRPSSPASPTRASAQPNTSHVKNAPTPISSPSPPPLRPNPNESALNISHQSFSTPPRRTSSTPVFRTPPPPDDLPDLPDLPSSPEVGLSPTTPRANRLGGDATPTVNGNSILMRTPAPPGGWRTPIPSFPLSRRSRAEPVVEVSTEEGSADGASDFWSKGAEHHSPPIRPLSPIHAEPSGSRAVINGAEKFKTEPAELKTPEPSRQNGSIPAHMLQTPKPPGAWAATPLPARLKYNGIRTPSPSPAPQSEVPAVTFIPSTPSPSTPPPAIPPTPAAPGAWIATPKPKGILKVRFDDMSVSSWDTSNAATPKPKSRMTMVDEFGRKLEYDADGQPIQMNENGMDTSAASSSTSNTHGDRAVANGTRKKKSRLKMVDEFGNEFPLLQQAANRENIEDGGTSLSKEGVKILESMTQSITDIGNQLHEESMTISAPIPITSLSEQLANKARLIDLTSLSRTARIERAKLQRKVQLVRNGEDAITEKIERLREAVRTSKALASTTSQHAPSHWPRWVWPLLFLFNVYIIIRLSSWGAKRIFMSTHYNPLYPAIFAPPPSAYHHILDQLANVQVTPPIENRTGWSRIISSAYMRDAFHSFGAPFLRGFGYGVRTQDRAWPPS